MIYLLFKYFYLSLHLDYFTIKIQYIKVKGLSLQETTDMNRL